MKKIVLLMPLFARGDLMSWLLQRLTGLQPLHIEFRDEKSEQAPEDWFVDGHFVVRTIAPTGLFAKRLKAGNLRVICLLRNIYDLLIDQYLYLSGQNGGFWRGYLRNLNRDTGISALITGTRTSVHVLPGLGTWGSQMQEMLRFSKANHCYLSSYEKLTHDTSNSVKKLAAYIDVELSEKQYDELVSAFTLEIGRRDTPKTGLSCAASQKHIQMLGYYHADMIQYMLRQQAPFLGSFGAKLGFPEVTALDRNIFVSAVFKSGTKLIEQVVAKLTGLAAAGPEEGSDFENAERIVFGQDTFFIWHSFPSDEVKAILRTPSIKSVFLVRNIYDLLVAQYFHFANDVDRAIGHSTHTVEYFGEMSRDEGLSLMLCGASSDLFHWNGFGYYLRQIQELLKFSKEYFCHIIVYDRLVQDKKTEVELLANFLEIALDSTLLEQIIDSSSLESMREARIAATGCGKHFRKGLPGDHANLLRPYHYHMMNLIKMRYAPDLDNLCAELGLEDVVSQDNGVNSK